MHIKDVEYLNLTIITRLQACPTNNNILKIGVSSSTLGVRIANYHSGLEVYDLDADQNGMVHKGIHGMSVTCPPSSNINPRFDRMPLWEAQISLIEQNGKLCVVPKTGSVTNYVIAPAHTMSAKDYYDEIVATLTLWKKI